MLIISTLQPRWQRMLFPLARVTVMACCLMSALWAQRAALRGVVLDESGAAVANAQVTLSSGTAPDRQASADERGAYRFNDVPAGRYMLRGTAIGLASAQSLPVVLRSGEQTADLRLSLLVRTEQVTVQDNAGPAISTDTANNASALVLTGADLDALADNPDDLQADLQALAGPAAGPNGGSIYVDGFSGGEIPPKDSIREIRINQDPFSAEYDKLGYGRIEIFTKPGSGQWHGTADFNYGTSAWNTRNPYASQKAPLKLLEWEGGGGGPLGKRASFTLDAQHNQVDNGFVVNAVTLQPDTLGIQPFSTVYETPQRFTRLNPRVDFTLNERHTLTLRYSFTHGDINGAGIGSFDLPSRGYRTQYTHNTLQASETAVIGSTVNELRFQYFRDANRMLAFEDSPAVQVLGSFTSGGATLGRSYDTQDSYELQNYTSVLRGTHTVRFGVRLRAYRDSNIAPVNFNGTYTFGGGLAPALDAANQAVGSQLEQIDSIERYRRTLLFTRLGYSAAQIRALGGGATQFTLSAGTPGISGYQVDAGLFAGDTWRARPNLTLSYGVRYEAQTNLSDGSNLSPRLSLAWAPGGANRRKTVVRAGFGVFYDRFVLANSLAVERYNGLVQQQYVLTNPDTYPATPPTAALTQQAGQTVQRLASDLRAPYLLQGALSVERQLRAGVTLAVTYTNSRGVHLLRQRNVNAPAPTTGAYPLGQPGALFLTESSGFYRQNQLVTNINAKVNGSVSLFGLYTLNQAKSDTDGVNTSPANPYSLAGEYGPAATDVRHRVTAGGSLNVRWNVRLSPFFILQSGAPFNITTGSDLYGTTLFNARPGFAVEGSRPGLVQTDYGLLDPNPTNGERLVPRNYGRGPVLVTANLRIAKTIGFGAEKKSAGSGNAMPAAQASVTGAGPNIRSLLGAPSAPRRYNLILSLSIRNLLNHNNPGPIIGNITSPLFGRANAVAGAPNGEGFSENASNRRLEAQLRFNF